MTQPQNAEAPRVKAGRWEQGADHLDDPEENEKYSKPKSKTPQPQKNGVVVNHIEVVADSRDRMIVEPQHDFSRSKQKPREEDGRSVSKDKKKKSKSGKPSKKCAVCNRKRTGKETIPCKTCSRLFHVECVKAELEKAGASISAPPRKFHCESCAKSLLKDKELKQKLKLAKAQEKTAFKMNNQSKKMQKTLVFQPLVRKQPVNVQAQLARENQMEEFARAHPYYAHKNRVLFPVEDDLFDHFPLILVRTCGDVTKPEPTQHLTEYFGTVVEFWNAMQTFSDYFEEEQFLTIHDLQSLLEYKDKKLCFIENMFVHLLSFYIADIFDQRFEMNKQFVSNPFLALMRYCGENGAFERIFRFVWVEFLYQMSKVPQYERVYTSNPGFINIIMKLKQGENQLWIPDSLEEKLEMIKALLSGIVDTTSFHNQLYDKIDKGRQNHREKAEYLESIKIEEAYLNSTKETLKNLEKDIKDREKAIEACNERHQRIKMEKELDKLMPDYKKLMNERERANNNINIYKQNIEYMTTNPSSHSNVWLLGKDRERREYWFIVQHRDKVFVSTPDLKWYYYNYDKITVDLPKVLNTKGTREKQLHDTLANYKKNNYFHAPLPSSHHGEAAAVGLAKNSQQHMKIVMDQQKKFEDQWENYLQKGDFDFDKQKLATFDGIKRMMIDGEKKIFNYLDERHARWASSEDRQIFIANVKAATSYDQILELVKHLNQKICVVEVETDPTTNKYSMDDDSDVGGNKTRKIQTKMWGINEKYKHAWIEYSKSVTNLLELFFLVGILYLTIQRYVKKMRETKKTKKDIEEPKPTNNKKNKLINKNSSGENKEMDASQWEELCGICKKYGDLLCCDLCPKVFHLECIGLKEVPEGDFKCKECEKKRQTRSGSRKMGRV